MFMTETQIKAQEAKDFKERQAKRARAKVCASSVYCGYCRCGRGGGGVGGDGHGGGCDGGSDGMLLLLSGFSYTILLSRRSPVKCCNKGAGRLL